MNRESVVDKFRESYNYFKQNKKKREKSHLLLPLSYEAEQLAMNNYLNNYELSTWEGYYLELWNKQPDLAYVSVRSLLTDFNVSNVTLFKDFLSVNNDGKITPSQFLEFIILFAFYENSQLYTLLFTVSGVKSNIFMTEQQIETYLRKLGVFDDYKDCLDLWLNGVEKDANGAISIDAFSRLLTSYPGLSYPLYYVRNFIIEKVIGYDSWNVIIRRRNYYSRMSLDSTVTLPKESCLSQLKRKLITHYPPPFHYDHKPAHSSNKSDSLSRSCVNELRKRYGYSSRPARMSCSGSVKLSCSYSNNKNRSSLNSLVNLSSVECI